MAAFSAVFLCYITCDMSTEAQLKKAFQNGARLIADQAAVGRLKDALRRGDLGSAMDAVNVDEAAWDELRVLLVQTYAEGGVSEVSGMSLRDRPRWNSASPRAEDYARNVIGGHITRITNDAREAVRWTIGDSVAFGRSVDRTALDIVGRVGPNGRTGGIVGLNQQQAQWVSNMRHWLEADPARALQYSKRDRRFDAVIQRAIASGKPLTKDQIDRITSHYSDNMLRVRGLTIARTERGSAINAGRQEAWRQAADRAGLDYMAIWKEWRHSNRQMEPRLSHIFANGDRVQGLDTPFNIGGFTCLHPHDPSLPAGEVINCGCTVRYGINRSWRNG